MNLLPLITRLKKSGITIELAEEDKLKLRAPEGSLTPEILSELKENKPALIEFLQQSQLKRKSYISMEPSEKKEFYLLSSAQKRLYLFQCMAPDGICCNMPYILLLEGDPDLEKLEQAFKTLISRHETLRTSIRLVDKEPVQKVHGDASIKINHYQVDGAVEENERLDTMIRDFIRPFDLSRTPFLRVGLARLGSSRHALMIDMHHIVSDGMSLRILVKEFFAAYAGRELPPLKFQYKDYAQWQHRGREKESFQQQESYWLRQFSGKIAAARLPLDHKRGKTRKLEGRTLRFNVPLADVEALSAGSGATMFMALLAVFNVLIAKLGNREDVIVGTSSAGQRDADLEHIIGMVVNTMALRNYPTAEKTFWEFLGEVRERTLEAQENQDYPIEIMLEKIGIERDCSRNPLFDVVFALQNINPDDPGAPGKNNSSSDISGLKITPYFYSNPTAKFDMLWNGVQMGQRVEFSIEYSTGLFKEETIRQYIGYFKRIMSIAIKNPFIKLGQIDIIPREEKKRAKKTRCQSKPDQAMEPGEIIAPRNDVEKKLYTLWTKILEREGFGVTCDFYRLGGSSIKSLLLVSEMQKEFDVNLLITDLYEMRTIEELANYLKGILTSTSAPL